VSARTRSDQCYLYTCCSPDYLDSWMLHRAHEQSTPSAPADHRYPAPLDATNIHLQSVSTTRVSQILSRSARPPTAPGAASSERPSPLHSFWSARTTTHDRHPPARSQVCCPSLSRPLNIYTPPSLQHRAATPGSTAAYPTCCLRLHSACVLASSHQTSALVLFNLALSSAR
jgi:hypothetical protein